MVMNLSKLRKTVEDRGAWCARVQHNLVTEQQPQHLKMLGPGALGRPRGIGWRGRWEGGWGWGIHVTPRLIHVNV